MKFIKVVLTIVALFVIGYQCYLLLGGGIGASNEANLKFVQEHMNGRGELVDYHNEIYVRSIDDIKVFEEKGILTIEFGYLYFEYKVDDFMSEEVLDKLKTIGIEAYKSKEGKIIVTYKGEEIERWVR